MSAAAPRKLGKGLSALMGEGYAPPVASAGAAGTIAPPAGTEIALADIRPGKYQPRRFFDHAQLQELADSIAQSGIMQPILLRPISGEDVAYEVIAGERRFRAAKLAGLQAVPAIIRELSDSQALELAIVENVQRQDLNPLEEAQGYQRLMQEFRYTQEQLAGTVGKSRSHVANLLRLLALPEAVKQQLDSGELTMGHARALLKSDAPEAHAKKIIEQGLSVREAEDLTRARPKAKQQAPRMKRPAAPATVTSGPKDADIIALEESLSETLGLKVQIVDQGESGEIRLVYGSLEQLDDIIRRLSASI